MPSLVKLVTDSDSIEIPETALSLKIGEKVTTVARPIAQIEGLKWWLEVCPAGFAKSNAVFISVFVKVTKHVDIRTVFTLKNTTFEIQDSWIADDNLRFGYDNLFSHDYFLNNGAIHNGKFVITCKVEFEVPIIDLKPLPNIHALLLKTCPQIAFKVGDESVLMNKAILTSISPVFHAMFDHDTKEAKINVVEIKDFDIDTVYKVMYFCLGIELNNLTTKESIEMLKFADKYDIQGLQKYFEAVLIASITADNICDIVNYAWTYSRDTVNTKCACFFSKSSESVVLTSAFADLEPTVMSSLVKAAVEFKSR
uniref:BTB domain-containing protein n=1 Tax=Panagrellus redivivus TaxID=6233 RepID=A0A7E4VPS8_PANRE